jgi:hypothetical protein
MLVFVVFNVSLLWADLHNEKLLSWLRLWQFNDSQVKPRGYLHYLDMDESAAANEASIKALDWASFSAEYHANRASYLLYISYSAKSDRYALLQQADRHIKQAIHLLPTWPYYPLLRMQILANQGVFGMEYMDTLKRALLYGQWELELLEDILLFNADKLDKVDVYTQGLLIDSFLRLSSWNIASKNKRITVSESWWQLLESKHQKWLWCMYLPARNDVLKHCSL